MRHCHAATATRHRYSSWTPNLFQAGEYNVTFTVTDGNASANETVKFTVANTNQAPVFTYLPTQSVREGSTLSFSVLAGDPDADSISYSVVTGLPTGAFFDSKTGAIEWTPTFEQAGEQAGVYNVRFAATDVNAASTTQDVTIRVSNVNRPPVLTVQQHAVLLGQELHFNVQGADADTNTTLNYSAVDLPQGATLNATTGEIRWTPGPGQAGDYLVRVSVSDGITSTMKPLVLRAVTEPLAPSVTIETTPSFPAIPGQDVVIHVLAQSFSSIANLTLTVNGQNVALDAQGRATVRSTQPGKLQLVATATDLDGFVGTKTSTLKIRDPNDKTAPAVSFDAVTANTIATAPMNIVGSVADTNLDYWVLEIAHQGSDQFTELARGVGPINGPLAQLDTNAWTNGVYQLRLTAVDISGRVATANTNLQIASTQKDARYLRDDTDVAVMLDGHLLDLTREYDSLNREQNGTFGYGWRLPIRDFQVESDVSTADNTGLGSSLPYREGTRVYVTLPDGQRVAFTFKPQLKQIPGLSYYLPVWEADNGVQWTLNSTLVHLQRAGDRFYDLTTGQPYNPQTQLGVTAQFTLTSPDGTQYDINAASGTSQVRFSDGVKWQVSDSGVVASNGDRVSFITESSSSNSPPSRAGEGQGGGTSARISRIVLSDGRQFAYSYDDAGNLTFVRDLSQAQSTRYGYAPNDTNGDTHQLILATAGLNTGGSAISYAGTPSATPLTGDLGAATNYLSHVFNGTLAAGATDRYSLAIRPSELNSSAAANFPPSLAGEGQGGGVVYLGVAVTANNSALQPAIPQLLGFTAIASRTQGTQSFALYKIDRAALLELDIAGVNAATNGAFQLSLFVAGDANHDGIVDGFDTQALNAAFGSTTGNANYTVNADFNLDGHVDSTDRQLLAQTYGYRANQAPTVQATSTLTHTDLDVDVPVQTFLSDLEGDTTYYRITGSTHGTATLSGNGKFVIFRPEAGYSGQATFSIIADDGYAQSPQATITVNVSSALLLRLNLARISSLAVGSAAKLNILGDFADQSNVTLSSSYLNFESSAASVVSVDVTGRMRANQEGTATIRVSRNGIQTVNALSAYTVQLTSAGDEGEAPDFSELDPHVYPYKLTLTAPSNGQSGGFRQLHISDISGFDLTLASTGTQYIIGNAAIVSVTPDGLITALTSGRTTISVVNAGGQTNIELNVEVPHANTALLSAATGGAVQSTTGETVMVGPDVLSSDAQVSIARIDVSTLSGQLPGAGALEAVGAFNLQLGQASNDQHATYPLQLAIPMQGVTNSNPGEEVLFLRKGEVRDATGTLVDTWWVVDNGFIGTDGIARTASEPYPGAQVSGEYLVVRHLPGIIGSDFNLTIGAGAFFSFGGLSLSGGLYGMAVASDIYGILATTAGSGTAGRYAFGIPQAVTVDLSHVPASGEYALDVSAELPPVVTPDGNVVVPNLLDTTTVTDAGEFKITIWNPTPGQFTGKIVLRALFGNGTYRDVQTFAGNAAGVYTVNPPNDIAVGSVRWQLVRIIDNPMTDADGTEVNAGTREYAGNTIKLQAKTDMAAVLTRTGITFVRENHTVGSTTLLDSIGTPNNFDGAYLTGAKVQPIAYSGDLSRVYVGGYGVIYVVDTLTYKLLDTIKTNGGQPGANITALVNTGDMLIIGEGNTYGLGVSHARLLVMSTNPGSADYNQPHTIASPDIDDSRLGISGMAIGPDGHTLVVAVPKVWNYGGFLVSASEATRGDILIFDLDTLNLTTGQIAAPIKAALPSDGISGKSPQTITATDNPDHFLVSDVSDYNRGLSTLVIHRDGKGNITSAEMNDIRMFQQGDQIIRDRLDIQRAQSAVLVTVDGVEYAIVSDDNVNADDPYWRAMFEAPDFIYMPFGPPIAVGGSASAKKVNVGGKLGIIQDPFGSAQYLGATLPLDGYGIRNLSVSDDGKVLLGQLYGKYGSVDSLTQKPHESQAWNVEALIQAAIANAPDGLSKHIVLPSGTEQIIPTQTSAPAGTLFDPPFETVQLVGNMGDVINVDLKKLLQDQYHLNVANLKGFKLGFGVLDNFIQPNADMRLVTVKDNAGHTQLYSRTSVTGDATLNFGDTGLFFITPNLKAGDLDKLRQGDKLNDKSVELTFEYYDDSNDAHAGWHTATIRITADDAAHGVFFGDRPLTDPGYSAFDLKGTVGVGLNNDKLDVTRVEQRLKYLAFPAMGYGGSGGSAPPTAIQDFKVDGTWENKEAYAAWLFDRVINYNTGTNYGGASAAQTTQLVDHLKIKTQQQWSQYNNSLLSSATRFVIYDPNPNSTDSTAVATNAQPSNRADPGFISYLNAYNAPHWMNISAEIDSGVIRGWTNTQNGSGTKVESFGTSWMSDLMKARQFASPDLTGGRSAIFTAGVDANQNYTPSGHLTHDLGMAFDLSVGKYMSTTRPAGPANAKNGVQYNPAAETSYNAATNSQAPFTVAALPQAQQVWSTNAHAIDQANQLLQTAHYQQLQNGQLIDFGKDQQQSAIKDFLSLYSVTRNNGGEAYGLDNLPLSNWDGASATQNTIRTALFGTGTTAGSIISKTLIGGTGSQNPLTNLGTVLTNLGISHGTATDHQNHFHIYLKPPAAVGITPPPHNLLTDVTTTESSTFTVTPELAASAQALLQQVQPSLGFQSGDIVMFPIDLPDAATQPAAVMIAQTRPTSTTLGMQGVQTIGICTVADASGNMGPVSIGPGADVEGYLADVEKLSNWMVPPSSITITVLENPAHGTLSETSTKGRYVYTPTSGYTGSDKVTFLVDTGSRQFKLVYFVKVYDASVDDQTSCDKTYWRISLSDIEATATLAGFVSPSSLLSYQLNQVDVSLNFANLANGAVGETTGHNITLDDNGGGYGWFIDSTPADNDEFLPTSNPNEFIAKAGSEAAGKMDMLTVLLHEYGHALGLDHSADLHDFMAEELQPGVRRTVSDADMEKLWSLIGEQINGDALSLALSRGAGEGTGGDPSLPFDPLSSLGLSFFFGFARRRIDTAPAGLGIVLPPLSGTDPNAVTINPTSAVTVNETPQHELATHTNVFNGDFSLADGNNPQFGWNTQGSVSMTSGAAELLESDRTLSGFSQAFVLPPDVRALRFTIEAAQFTANGAAPPDAFEVALLNSVTGLPVVGTVSLTHSDALFNLQSNGSLSVASGVTVNGLPNSTSGLLSLTSPVTVTVDVSNVPAGTSLKLYFDLLGLGAKGSRVVIDDVKLLTSLNTAPVAVNDVATTGGNAPVQIAVLANDTDAENDPLTPVLVTGAANGSVTLKANGSFTYVPNAGFSGTDQFTYRVSDGQAQSNVATVSVTVTPSNHAPVAVNDAVTTAEDTALHLDVRSNDTDIDHDALTVEVVTSPTNGALILNADGTFSYTPTANFNGTDQFTYRVSDGQALSNVATVSITVTAVNDAPIAVNDTAATAEDTAINIAVLANDSDIEHDTLTPTIVTRPAHGAVTTNADGSFRYTPAANFNGIEQFTYRVSDGQAQSNVATVTITVTPVNDAPLASNDAVTTAEDTAIDIVVLSNDSDVEGDALTPVLVIGPANGVVTINTNGSFTYTPNANFNGTDQFTYKASDGQAQSNVSTVTITVTPVNDPPVATNDVVTTAEDTAISINVLANDSDIENDSLTPVVVITPLHGSLVANADGSFSYTPNANYNGTDAFTYKVSDGQAFSNVATVNIAITPVNDPPVAVNDAVTTLEDTAATIAVLANDTDVEGDALTPSVVTGPAHGVLVLNTDGTFTYTPNANYNGTDAFTYKDRKNKRAFHRKPAQRRCLN